MITNIAQFADSSSGFGALGVDGKALIIQIITFLLAFWALQHWAFKPIMKVMDQRRETIDKGVKLGEKMQKEQVELEQKIAKTLQDARKDADNIIAEAKTQSRQTVQDAEANAKEKAEGIIAAAEDRIKRDTVRARKQLETELVGLISDATETIIDEKIDARKDATLIDKAMKGRA